MQCREVAGERLVGAEDLVALNVEVVLAGWSETSTGGRKCTFWFDEDSAEHPLKKFTVRRGKHAGTRFRMVLVEIGDDEVPVDQVAREQHETVVGGPISKHCGMLCRDDAFILYMKQRYPDSFTEGVEQGRKPDQIAAGIVRQICVIDSRAELDHNEQAAEIYQRDVVGAFARWSENDDEGTTDEQGDEHFDQQSTGEGFDGR